MLNPQGRRRLQVALLSVLLAAVAAPCLAQTDPSDPWERTNRKIYRFNHRIDRRIILPLAQGFAGAPSGVRRAVHNFSVNMGEPLVFVNDVLQGHPGQAATTVGRFAINSIFGLAGLFDVAAKGRIPHHDNGFGTTLGRWGVGPGPYVFLPLLGPSTVRDSFGSGVDIALNPFTYVRYTGSAAVGVVTTVGQGLERREEAARDLAVINETSTDPYATLRSYYLQNRQAEITGQAADVGALPDLEDPGASPAPAGSVSPAGSAAQSAPRPSAVAPPLSGEAGALPRPETTSSPDMPECATPPPPERASDQTPH